MNIYLTTTDSTIPMDCLLNVNYSNTLLSYAYSNLLPKYENVWLSNINKGLKNRIIIDSGAFTAFTLGKPITLQDYASWVKDIATEYSTKTTSILFMNLDVIGDQKASLKNQIKLENLGLNITPVFTFGANIEELKDLLNTYEYVALGGLVKRKDVKPWLDKCYRELLAHKSKTGLLIKTHLLGVCKEDLLQRYPCFSSDSSGWIATLR